MTLFCMLRVPTPETDGRACRVVTVVTSHFQEVNVDFDWFAGNRCWRVTLTPLSVRNPSQGEHEYGIYNASSYNPEQFRTHCIDCNHV